MNRRDLLGNHQGFIGGRRISNCFKDRDEELSFFRDLQKREKDVTLLQPDSDEFEANGNYGLYRKGHGLDFLAESGKNDYNWLKTPPQTPLFPSLEMETNAQELVVQKEIPILHPLSRFAGNQENKESSNTKRPKSPNPKPKLPIRHRTPTARPSVSTSLVDKKNMKNAPIITTQKTSNTSTNNKINTLPDRMKPAFALMVVKSDSNTKQESQPITESLATNLPKNKEINKATNPANPRPRSTSRGASSVTRPTIKGVTDEPHQNPRTTGQRPSSTTRGRQTMNNEISPNPNKKETNIATRRQSCSPSVARGRKLDSDGRSANERSGHRTTQQGGNHGQVQGSRMVARFMSARNSSAEKLKMNGSMNESSSMRMSGDEERYGKIKMGGSMNESSGFGRLMSKSSLDMALKHMEIQRDTSKIHKNGMVGGRKY